MEGLHRYTPEEPASLNNERLAARTASFLGGDFDETNRALRALLDASEGENPEATPFIAAIHERLGDNLGYEEPEEIED